MRRSVLVLVLALLLQGCAVTGIAFRHDDRLSFVTPDDRAEVSLPFTVEWETEDFDVPADGSYAVFVDRAPQLQAAARGLRSGLNCAVTGDVGSGRTSFLHRVLAEYKGVPVDLIWDNLQAHKSPIVKEVLAANPRLTLHYLPPYAPDLNAVEGVWCLSKYHRMANHSIDSVEALHEEAARHLDDIGRDQALLRSCFEGAGLTLTLERAQ